MAEEQNDKTEDTKAQKPEPVTEGHETAEQVEKQVPDESAKAGGDAQALEQREVAVKAREEAVEAEVTDALAEAQAELEELREIVRSSSDAIEVLQLKRGLKDKLKALDQRERAQLKHELSHKSNIESAVAIHRQAKINAIAGKHGVDAKVLQDLNLETEEQMEAVAKALGASRKAPVSRGGPPPPPEFVPDSGEGTGGLSGIDALVQANEDFNKGKISEKRLREIASRVT